MHKQNKYDNNKLQNINQSDGYIDKEKNQKKRIEYQGNGSSLSSGGLKTASIFSDEEMNTIIVFTTKKN